VSVLGKPSGTGRGLYVRWVLANAVGEAAGLGITALIGAAAVLYAGEETGARATLALGRGRRGARARARVAAPGASP
jgi:hypothetical protein